MRRAVFLVTLLLPLFAIPAVADAPPGFLLSWGSQGSDPGQFVAPNGIGVDPSGSVYVADFQLNRVQKFTPSGELVTEFGSAGISTGQFNGCADVATGPEPQVYVSDRGNGRIEVFDADGNYLRQFPVPNGFACGHLAVSQGMVFTTSAEFVFVFDTTGTFLTSWPFLDYYPGYFPPFGAGSDGRLYFPDMAHKQIRVYRPDGVLDGTWSTSGQTEFPYQVSVDSQDHVYVVDGALDRIVKFTSSGQFLTSWGSAGAGNGQFRGLCDLGPDDHGNIFTLELDNTRVQKFTDPTTPTLKSSWGHLKSKFR